MRQVKYTPKVVMTQPESEKKEWSGNQRFSDIHRCMVQDGFIIIKAHRDRNQAGDKHGKNIRDKIMTPTEALKWADNARKVAFNLAVVGEMQASAELQDIYEDLKAKIDEALRWRQAHNVSPDEIADLLKWKKNVY